MSDLIRTSRKRAGLTGAQLAERLGITAGGISHLERSERLGTIQIDTLQRVLDTLDRQLSLDAPQADAYAAYWPEHATNEINQALQEHDYAFAIRALTKTAQMIRLYGTEFNSGALERRPSELCDQRWEQLFRAEIGDAIQESTGTRPTWAQPQKLPRAWYTFGEFKSLRDRAKATTPERFRKLNIMIDARTLSRA
ncbi:MAG TPA: helix-turn-helix domain-containing protein [Candidatus Lumbricidophila sp.]|nr:helix-turn-helix domain-containing protein [Candidatus Lumbricidophila sp.]